MRELIFFYGFQWFPLELLVHDSMFYLRDLSFYFTSVHKGVLVKVQGCTRSYEWSFWIDGLDKLINWNPLGLIN